MRSVSKMRLPKSEKLFLPKAEPALSPVGIDRLEQLSEALQDAERRFAALIDALGSLVHVVAADGRILFCNTALRQWHMNLGLVKNPIGQKLTTVYPFWSNEIEDEYRQVFAEGKSHIGEKRARIGDREFILEVRQIPIFKNRRVVQVITTIQDITPLKRAEEALEKMTLQQEQLIKTARHLTESPDVTKVLEKIGAGAKAISKAQACAIYLLEKDGHTLSPVVTNDAIYSEEIMATPLDVDASFTGQAVKAKRGLIFNDAWSNALGQHIPGTPVEEQERILVLPLIIAGEVLGAMCLNRTGTPFAEEDLALAETFATYATTALKSSRTYYQLQQEMGERLRAEAELKQSFEKLQRLLEETVNVLLSAVEIRDPYTAGHQRRVTVLACAIAEEMELPKDQIDGLRMASLIHDVGKIYVPAEILSRPGHLTDTERDLIQIHSQAGYDVLKPIEFPWPVAQIVLQHHERLNGSGFPHGLTSEKILLEAKILGVADVVEAMSSHRPYRPAHALSKALEEIEKNKDILYEATVVEACLRLFAKKDFKLT